MLSSTNDGDRRRAGLSAHNLGEPVKGRMCEGIVADHRTDENPCPKHHDYADGEDARDRKKCRQTTGRVQAGGIDFQHQIKVEEAQ